MRVIRQKNPPDFKSDLIPILEIDARPFHTREAPAVFTRLAVAAVRRARFAAAAHEQWKFFAIEFANDQPTFNWQSVALFRPTDPILVLHGQASVYAMMQLRENYVVPCPLGGREPLVYVSFLEVCSREQDSAPHRKFRGLGQLMLRFACQRSLQLEFGGRIGLHALATAEPFYRKLGFDAPDCPNEYNELYFQLSEAKAQLLLSPTEV